MLTRNCVRKLCSVCRHERSLKAIKAERPEVDPLPPFGFASPGRKLTQFGHYRCAVGTSREGWIAPLCLNGRIASQDRGTIDALFRRRFCAMTGVRIEVQEIGFRARSRSIDGCLGTRKSHFNSRLFTARSKLKTPWWSTCRASTSRFWKASNHHAENHFGFDDRNGMAAGSALGHSFHARLTDFKSCGQAPPSRNELSLPSRKLFPAVCSSSCDTETPHKLFASQHDERYDRHHQAAPKARSA